MYDWTKMCNMLICHAMLKLKAFSLSILVGFLYTKALSICICMRFVMLYLFCICLSTLGSSMERFFLHILCFFDAFMLLLLRYFHLFRTLTSKRIKKINSGNFFVACCPDKHVQQIAGKTDEKKQLKRCFAMKQNANRGTWVASSFSLFLSNLPGFQWQREKKIYMRKPIWNRFE